MCSLSLGDGQLVTVRTSRRGTLNRPGGQWIQSSLTSIALLLPFAGDRLWPTDDGLHPLNAHPKPDAQGAAAKVSFAVLYSPVARPAFGKYWTSTAVDSPSALNLEADNQRTCRGTACRRGNPVLAGQRKRICAVQEGGRYVHVNVSWNLAVVPLMKKCLKLGVQRFPGPPPVRHVGIKAEAIALCVVWHLASGFHPARQWSADPVLFRTTHRKPVPAWQSSWSS